jgi:hypothetical protein
MSFSKILPLISLLAAASMSTMAFAQVSIDPSAVTAMPKLLPGTVAAFKKSCTNVDLGISSVRIDKLTGGFYTATYEIRNFGRDAWESSQGQAGSILTMVSTRVSNPGILDTLIPRTAAPGAIVQTVTSLGSNYIDRNRRDSRQPQARHTLDILITFDPDILNDSNTCNDDAQVQNNSFYLGSKLNDFLFNSRDRSKTFTFADRQGPLPMSERTRPR